MTKARDLADLNFASPELTGTPIAPTAAAGTNTTQIATTAFVGTGIANLVDSSPDALNTLNELAAALGDDANFSTTVTNSIATKAPLASPTFTGTATVPTLNSTTAIQMGGTEVLNSSRQLSNIASVDATTVAALSAAGLGGGGAQYDFTADGAITAGDVVALTGAGNAKVTVASSYTAPSDIGFGAGFGSGDRQSSHATCPRTGRKIFVATYATHIYAIGYTYSGGTFTYGSSVILKNGGTKSENIHVIATGRADGEFAIFYQQSSNNYVTVRIANVAADRTVSNRGDGEYDVDTTGDQILFQKGIALIGGANQTSPVIACFHDNKGNPSYSSDYFAAITAIQVNSSSVSVGSTYSNQLSVSGSSSGRTDDFANLVWDSTNSRLIAAWRENGGNCSVRFITNSGTTLTIGSRVSISPVQATTNTAKFNLVWDDDADHGVIFHYYDNNAVLVARTLYSDGSISPTYTVLEDGSNGTTGAEDKNAVLINPNNNQIVYRRIGSFLNQNHHCFYVVKVSAGGDVIPITSPSGPIIYSESSTSTNYFVYDNRGTLGYHYDDYNDIIMSPFYYRSSSSQPVVATISVGTTYDYLGVADNTVTNGQTVTVNLAGSVDENQTGLSAGTTYYAGGNGALATSGDRKVGKALSATAILITGAND